MTSIATPPAPRTSAPPGAPGGPGGVGGAGGVHGSARPPAGRRSAPLMLLPSLLGALAVLAGSSALVPLLDSLSWVLPLVEVVAVIYLVGVGSRLLSIPPWGTALLQVAGLLIALTSLYTDTGIAGVIPGPAAFSQAASMLGAAWDQILTTVPPAPTTPELGLLIALTVGVVAVVADVLIAGARVPALVALPLLSLFSVPASIDTHMLPWYAFVAPAALFTALLAVAGHAGWHLQSRVRASLGFSGVAIAAVTIVVALLVADSITGIGTAGRLPRGTHPGGDIGLNPWALLHGDLQKSTPTDTLVVSGLDHPTYLRTFALEKWTPDKGFGFGPVVADDHDIDGAVPDAPAPNSSSTKVTITPQKYRDQYLPIYPDTTGLGGLATGWNYDTSLQTVFRNGPVTPTRYTVTANIARPTAAELETENVDSGGPLTETGTLPAEVVATAKSVTAGARTPFDEAEALLHYFTDPANGFTYSLTVPTGNSGSALLDFLNNKQGYCEQYAAAMAIMLRSLGIPARVGVGFTQGTRQPNGSYLITSTDAHAWVEVKFDKSGWVSFDPTPVVDGQGGLQGYQPGNSGTAGGASPATTAPSTTSTTTAATPTHSLQGVVPTLGRRIPELGQSGSQSGAQPSALWHWVLVIVVVVAALLVVTLVLLAPSTLRRARRRRRLATAAGGSPGAGSAAWAEIEDTLTDHGIEVHDVESARVAANRLARTAHLSTSGREDLRTVVTTAEREWYGESPSAGGPDLAPGVRAVVDGLERNVPRSWQEKLVPRSMRPGGRRRPAR